MTTVHGSMDNAPIIDETAAGSPDELLDAAHDIVLPGDDRVLHLGDNSERDPAAAVVDRLLGFRVGPSIEIGDELADFLVNDRPRRVGVVLSTFVVPTEPDEGSELGLASLEEIPALVVPDRNVVPCHARRGPVRSRVRVGMAGVASLAVVATLGIGQVLPAAAQSLFGKVVGVVGTTVDDGPDSTPTVDRHDSSPPVGATTVGATAKASLSSAPADTPTDTAPSTSAAIATSATTAATTWAAAVPSEGSTVTPSSPDPSITKDPADPNPGIGIGPDGTPPGHEGTPPGQTITPPGQGGTPPGQAKKTEGVTP